MCCKGSFIKVFIVLLLGFTAINFMTAGKNDLLPHVERTRDIHVSNPGYYPVPELPSSSLAVGPTVTQSEPLAYLFQILFILFIASPPLIVVLLFLIWRELKARNRMK
ncbi:MAG: hypothetical protein JSS81_21825 [Acidobacteria bacterium]|nr:hypothetical protein [Acidobacteriota bacterium]